MPDCIGKVEAPKKKYLIHKKGVRSFNQAPPPLIHFGKLYIIHIDKIQKKYIGNQSPFLHLSTFK